jgi:hypothetical protein
MISLETIEKAEFETTDALFRMPYAAAARPQLHQALINLRIAKRKMLVANPEILRKSNTSRRDLPADDIAVKAMVAEARDRQSEEQRLGHHHRDEIPDADALTVIKNALAKPILGDRGLVGFLNRNATAP